MAAGTGPWEESGASVPKEWVVVVLSTGLSKCTTKAPTCLFQAPHVSLGMASLAGSKLECCGGAVSSCSLHSCLFPRPPLLSFLLAQFLHCCTLRHIFLQCSPFPPETQGEAGLRIMQPNTVVLNSGPMEHPVGDRGRRVLRGGSPEEETRVGF